MASFILDNQSSLYSPVRMEIVGEDHLPAYRIVEESTVLRSLFRWLRLRALFPLTLTLHDLKRGDRYVLHRHGSILGFGRWTLKRSPSIPIVSFEWEKISIGPVPLFPSFTTRLILNSTGVEIGRVIKKNPFIVGPQRGTLFGRMGERMGEFAWGQFSLTKGYARCTITMALEDPFWELIGISSAIIWGMDISER